MYIKKLELNNFRIYKQKHSLFFNPEKDKNVFVISGNNGYGKTTFLTSLVWCLYGKQMKDVDDFYKTQINETGGYPKFIQSCLNRLAHQEGENDFFVSITFSDIDVPSITCEEITIQRTGHFKRGTDKLDIFIDGGLNELTKEVGNEIFIQDFILPKEVAKFFFFDSEKIVSLAESKSIASKRQLSRAYSEVLGIKKYEDLRKNLVDLTLRFKKNSAKAIEKEKF
ncbi:MAG: AAA family ATPase, partial [Bacteroidota bacterium]